MLAIPTIAECCCEWPRPMRWSDSCYFCWWTRFLAGRRSMGVSGLRERGNVRVAAREGRRHQARSDRGRHH
jgi:hypothetical protein